MKKLKKYRILTNSKKSGAVDYAEEIKKELLDRHCVVVSPALDNAGMFVDNADVYVVVGGDGTMLSTVGLAPLLLEKLFLGLNFGDTGFMMNDVIPVEDAVNRILQGKFDVISFPLLEITSNGKIAFALNDFFFKANGPQTCKFYAQKNGDLIFDKSKPIVGDGGVISTPLGSTGYNLSAGGPVISHNAQVISFTGIAISRPRGLPSYILSFDDEIEVEILYFDEGQVGVFKDNFSLPEFGPKIKIKMSNITANLAFWKGANFSKRLNDKILRPLR